MDLILRAAHEVFRKDTTVCKALNVLYLRHMMLRPVVDVLVQRVSDECRKKRA